MTIDFSPLTPAQITLRFTDNIRGDLATLSAQISSGNKHSDYVGFAEEGNAEKYVSLKSVLDGLDSYKRSIGVANTRILATEQAISEIQKVADEFASVIVARRNSAAGSAVPVGLLGDSALGRVANNLNAKADNIYIFSGSKTNTPPVPSLEISNIGSDGVATASYYKGDSVKPSVRTSDTQEVEYGTLANEPGFKKLIGAIHLAMEGDSEEDDSKLASAMDMINEAVVDIAGTMTTIKATVNTLAGIRTSVEDAELLTSDNFIKVGKTDIVDATTKMSELEAQLEASFIAYTRLSRLRLSDYL